MSQFSDADELFSSELTQEPSQKASSSKKQSSKQSSTSKQSTKTKTKTTKESKKPEFNIQERQFSSNNHRDLKKGLFNLPKSDLVWILKWLKHTNNYEGNVTQNNTLQQIQKVLKENSEVIIRDLVPHLQVNRVIQPEVEEDSEMYKKLQNDSCEQNSPDKGEKVALFDVEGKKAAYVGHAIVSSLQQDELHVTMTEVSTDFEDDYEIGKVYSWNPEHACKDTVFQNRRLTLEELQAQKKFSQVTDQEAKIKELVSQLEECQKENDKLKKENKILKRKKSSNDTGSNDLYSFPN